MRHPRDMGVAEVQAFLNMLANEPGVSPSTHNQALSALLFLYPEVWRSACAGLMDWAEAPNRNLEHYLFNSYPSPSDDGKSHFSPCKPAC